MSSLEPGDRGGCLAAGVTTIAVLPFLFGGGSSPTGVATIGEGANLAGALDSSAPLSAQAARANVDAPAGGHARVPARPAPGDGAVRDHASSCPTSGPDNLVEGTATYERYTDEPGIPDPCAFAGRRPRHRPPRARPRQRQVDLVLRHRSAGGRRPGRPRPRHRGVRRRSPTSASPRSTSASPGSARRSRRRDPRPARGQRAAAPARAGSPPVAGSELRRRPEHRQAHRPAGRRRPGRPRGRDRRRARLAHPRAAGHRRRGDSDRGGRGPCRRP